MCQECGCHNQDHQDDQDHKEESETIALNKSLMEKNDSLAHEIWHKLQDQNIFCINLLGSPGSGKTTFIENISDVIGNEKIAVIQGDLESDIDKIRLEKKSISTYQINTHSGCHLNSDMVNKAIEEMDLKEKDFLIIENVGNLVCPAGVKIGQHLNLVVSSTTEGSDKPKKYPFIFMDAGLIAISKYDLADAVDFDEETYLNDIKNINGETVIVKVSNKNKQGTRGFKEAAEFLIHTREHLINESHARSHSSHSHGDHSH